MTISIKIPANNNLDDINQLIRLSKSHWKYDQQFLDRFMEAFSVSSDYLEKSTARIAYIDDQLAGFYSFSLHPQDTWELDNLFLHPDQIGKGLGVKLWESCCQTAKELGISEFTLWSDPNAEPFYLKVGCQKIGVRQSPMMPDRFPPVMRFVIR